MLNACISLIDLTSLGDQDTDQSIIRLCQKAAAPYPVAAVCVYPQFVALAKKNLSATSIKIATVANFPSGQDPLHKIRATIEKAVAEGADEIDMVFPYELYLRGEKAEALQFIQHCSTTLRELSPSLRLKVILETGAIPDLVVLTEICESVILAGADFLKTSTGKISVGATLEAARVMLMAIQNMQPSVSRVLGFKASGGVREPRQAQAYIDLAREIMGPAWVSPKTFRLGASQLLDEVLKTL